MIASYTALNQENYVTYARGMEALSLQDYETAKSHLERAATALPDFAPAFLGLGLTYEQLGELEAALMAIERGLAINPDDFAALEAQSVTARTYALSKMEQREDDIFDVYATAYMINAHPGLGVIRWPLIP